MEYYQHWSFTSAISINLQGNDREGCGENQPQCKHHTQGGASDADRGEKNKKLTFKPPANSKCIFERPNEQA